MIPSFVEDLARGGDAPALVFPNNRIITYAELARRVDQQSRTFGAGKRLIALEARLSEHAIIAYLAALKAGHAIAMLPPNDPAAAARFEASFQPDCEYRIIDGRWRALDMHGAPGSDLHPDLALLLFTSGSTGVSRAVRLSARNLDSNATAIATFLGLQRGDRAALILPLQYSYGLSVLNSHLAAGASVFIPGKSILDAGFMEDLRRSESTNLAGVPYSYDLLEQIRFRDEHLPALRFLTVAGGKLSPELVARYHTHLSASGKRFFVMYGQTEATARIAFVPPDQLATNTDKIGIAIPGGELRLADLDGQPLDASETPGELVYRGPNVMLGYAHTRADLSRGYDLTELKTGDLAVRDHRGFYRIVGRLHRMSKIAGLRIAHDALEQALADHGITAAVVGDDTRILAVYSSAHSESEVRQRLAEASKLPGFHIEAKAVEALPRLPSGKIDYEKLKAELAARSAEPARHSENIPGVFAEAFFPRTVRARDSFISLGGDSLRHLQVSIGIEKVLGYIPDGWESIPVSQLAALRREKTSVQTIGTDLVIRALAILVVVMHHATLWPIPGGAAAMLMLVGYSLARFQSNALFSGDPLRPLKALGSVLVPYYLVVAGFAIARHEVPWASVFLVGNFGIADPADHTMLPIMYWFVEAYTQLLLIWTALFLIPPVRKMARQNPFAFGLALLAGAMVARFVGPSLWELGDRQFYTLLWNGYMAAIGWSIFFADTPRKKIILLAAGTIVFPLAAYFGGNWIGAWVKYSLQFLCLSALLFTPRIRMPKQVVSLILPVSAASYHIYLFHRLAPEWILRSYEATWPWPVFTFFAITGGVAVGLLAHRLQKIIAHGLTAVIPRIRLSRRLRKPAPQPASAVAQGE